MNKFFAASFSPRERMAARSVVQLKTNRTVLVAVVVSALLLWLAGRWQFRQAQNGLAAAAERKSLTESRLTGLQSELAAARRQLAQITAEKDQTMAAVHRAKGELQLSDPESAWAEPPDNWPQWDSASPYVWLRKEMLPMLPVPVFRKDGGLEQDLGAVLALNEASQARLNTKLQAVLAEYRRLELANAEPVAEPFLGSASDRPTATVRIKPLPQEGAQAKLQFEHALREELGPQRADLVLQTAQGWLESQFSLTGTEPKTISVRQDPDGRYNIAIRQGGGLISVGGAVELDEYVPPHLVPVFRAGMEAARLQPDAKPE